MRLRLWLLVFSPVLGAIFFVFLCQSLLTRALQKGKGLWFARPRVLRKPVLGFSVYSKILIVSLMVGGSLGFYPFALAQTGHFVLIQQGALNQVSSDYNNQAPSVYVFQIGTGYTGTTTGAFVSADFNKTGATPVVLELNAFSDAAYSTNVGNCQYAMQLPNGYYSATTTGFIQLDRFSFSGTGCQLLPADYYTVRISFAHQVANGVTGNSRFYGEPTNTTGWILDAGASATDGAVAVPQFAIVADGFQITPTASSSGISLSGATQFCNSAFASSSAPGIVTDFGIALCDTAGFLFIPSSDSVAQFGGFSTLLSQRFPFSWGFGVKDLLNSLAASSTTNYPSYSYAIGTTTGIAANVLSGDLVIANPTSIQKLAPDAAWTFIRYLIGVILWISFAYFVYRKVINIWHVQT